MLAASNPNISLEQRKITLNELLSQIYGSPTTDKKDDGKSITSSNIDKQFLEVNKKIYEDDFQRVVIGYLVNISESTKQLKNEIKGLYKEIRNTHIRPTYPGTLEFATNSGRVMNVKQLAEKYPYVIPLPTMEDFERFDKELGDPNSPLRSDFNIVLSYGIDKSLGLSKSIVQMLKMILTKEVAMQFTAVKQAKGKKIMKTTNVFSCIEAIIREHRSLVNMQTTDKEITTALSNVVSNALNWHKSKYPESSRRSTGHSSEQDDLSQSEIISTYELLPIDNDEPLFETKYLD